MLSETDIHYLVGLLSLISNPDDVEVELGSRIVDKTTKRKRDVDITFRVKDPKTGDRVFKAIEVKDHGRKLDVTHVEQLAQKLNDMPTLAVKGIVSAKGYTSPAIKKAAYHKIELFELVDWDFAKYQFEHFKSEFKPFVHQGFAWLSPPDVKLQMEKEAEPFAEQILMNSKFCFSEVDDNQIDLSKALVNFKSAALAEVQKRYQSKTVASGHCVAVNAEMAFDAKPFILNGSKRFRVKSIKILGTVRWETKEKPTLCKVLKKVGEAKPFAGCMIADLGDLGLVGISISQLSNKLNWVQIPKIARNAKMIPNQTIRLQ